MRAVPPRAAPPDPAPYAAAEAAFAAAKAYLCSREARQMSESDLERELHRRGQELMRKLLQGHLDQRSPGEAAGPVAGDEVERSERRVHERHLETTFGTVQVERLTRAPVTTVASARCRTQPAAGAVLARGAPPGGGRPRRGPLTKHGSICLAVPGHRCPSVRRNSWWFARLRTSTPSTRHAVRRGASRPRSCIPSFCKHQITPKTSRYTRCSMSMFPNASINGRIRSSGQLGRWWYSISPCRNNECVRRFTVFAFNQRS